jgi:hypothetical protein
VAVRRWQARKTQIRKRSGNDQLPIKRIGGTLISLPVVELE